MQSYYEAISETGAVPVIVPPLTRFDALEEWLREIRVDRVLLSGGADVNPILYGEKPLPALGRVSDQRDTYELGLLKVAMERRVPVLGICRGLQVVNVAFGGTLVQDMASQLGEEFRLHDQSQPTEVPVHEVDFTEGSVVARLFGANRLEVNSHHHQCVERVGHGLAVTGKSPDGIVEAVEAVDYPVFAVQFHPERMLKTVPAMRLFFSNWVAYGN